MHLLLHAQQQPALSTMATNFYSDFSQGNSFPQEGFVLYSKFILVHVVILSSTVFY